VSEELELNIENGLATINLNRPQVMNAMTFAMWARLLKIFQDLEHDASVRCVLLTGTGANFCSGQDVAEFADLATLSPADLTIRLKRELDTTNPVFQTMERIPQPVIASVRGLAAGGGLSLVTAADLIVASDTAKFLVAQIKLGAMPDASVGFNLRRAIGIKRAKQYCFLGEMMTAEDAGQLGLVNWVVPDGELEQQTEAVIQRLLRTSPIALARTKSSLNKSFTNTLAEHAAQEAVDIGLCVSGPDFMNNVRAFVERKREK
jgi:2-(1,2-epoxy-1,2-dihydrophenyl)acetyl-CoA isomerase